jgi:energy-coupling factor transport system ATP-binding protein
VALPLISLRDATVAHGDGLPPALHGVSLDVHRGDWIAVTGDNGSGKTTLLATLGGVLPLRSGTMERAPSLRVALLLQDPDNQMVSSRVEHELALSVPREIDGVARRARISEAIERFALATLLARNPHRLSGGEKQRLALATVWLESPDVLLLDEPLSFLDREMRERVLTFVREMNASGTAIAWATPGGSDVDLARETIVLSGGRVEYSGKPPRTSRDSAAEPLTSDRGSGAREERLRFDSVSFGYEQGHLIDKLNFRANSGERVHITGRNGSGKSTFLLLAGGALAPSSGRITLSGYPRRVLYLPQSPERLFFAETVSEEIGFGLLRRGASFLGTPQLAEKVLEVVGLEPGASFAARSPFELSFGEMRRVAFAIAVSLDPGLLLLDEPTSCLDAAGRAVLDRVIRRAVAQGATVMIASHEESVPSDGGRVLELRDGALIDAAGPHVHSD